MICCNIRIILYKSYLIRGAFPGKTEVCRFAARGMRPPFSLVLPKKTGRARSKRKTLFVQTCPSGQVWGCERLIASFPQICPAPSECAATRLATHAYAASCDVAFHSRVLVKAPCFSSRCRSRGWIPKEGAAAPSFWSFRKGVQGETQPKGFPPGLSLGATRFSRREKWVAYAQVR